MKPYDLEWWPKQLQEVFAAIGIAMAGKRLRPEMLSNVPLSSDRAVISHVSGKEIGQRKGYYVIEIDRGRWKFMSGQLERLARAAVDARCQGSNQ
jgi:hypothetical protein